MPDTPLHAAATDTSTPQAPPALHLDHICMQYNVAGNTPVDVLKSITLTIPQGQAYGIVGPSGAGKSTLMMVAGGLEAVTSGTVTVAGTDITRMGESALARFRRDHIGIVFQNFHLIPTMTAIENVAVPLELANIADARDKAQQALDYVGLGHRLHHTPGQLSGGEQQRVALARAIVVEPKLLLADEPTGNLDGQTGTMIMDLLFDLQARTNATLLLITHDMKLAERCDAVVKIIDGRVAS
jgi:putative ABC transport system ATP-binding protein